MPRLPAGAPPAPSDRLLGSVSGETPPPDARAGPADPRQRGAGAAGGGAQKTLGGGRAMRNWILAILCGLLLAGCATSAIYLRHPDGRKAKCGPYFVGGGAL